MTIFVPCSGEIPVPLPSSLRTNLNYDLNYIQAQKFRPSIRLVMCPTKESHKNEFSKCHNCQSVQKYLLPMVRGASSLSSLAADLLAMCESVLGENYAPTPYQEILTVSEKVIGCHIANQHLRSNAWHEAVCGSRPFGTQIENYILKITRGFNSRQIRLFGFNVQAEPHAARWELIGLQFNF